MFEYCKFRNNKIAKVIKYQPQGKSNYLSAKRIKIKKEKGACRIKLF